MFPLNPPENIRNLSVFWCFQGDQKGTLGKKGLKRTTASPNLISVSCCILNDLNLPYPLEFGLRFIFIFWVLYQVPQANRLTGKRHKCWPLHCLHEPKYRTEQKIIENFHARNFIFDFWCFYLNRIAIVYKSDVTNDVKIEMHVTE